MESNTQHVSFIGIVDFTQDARWLYASESVHDLLGYEPHELIGTPAMDLIHPDEFAQVREMHYSTIKQDKAAVLAYLRMKHKDPCKGYILCSVTRTVCQNVLAGSISFATPGPKAMHNASTAQEVTIISPAAKDFEFRRWNDPNPMPPCPVGETREEDEESDYSDPGSPTSEPIRFTPLPEQSVRTLLILDRFSQRCTVLYCANDSMLLTTSVMGRSFFDFVSKRNEELVRSWITTVKGWGVNERGQPSDGGFGFGKFTLCINGRDSSNSEIPTARQRPSASYHQNPYYTSRPSGRRDVVAAHSVGRGHRSRAVANKEEIAVDAIFSAHSDGLMVILRYAS